MILFIHLAGDTNSNGWPPECYTGPDPVLYLSFDDSTGLVSNTAQFITGKVKLSKTQERQVYNDSVKSTHIHQYIIQIFGIQW